MDREEIEAGHDAAAVSQPVPPETGNLIEIDQPLPSPSAVSDVSIANESSSSSQPPAKNLRLSQAQGIKECFVLSSDGKRKKCRCCKKDYSVGSSLTTLQYHIQAAHIFEWNKIREVYGKALHFLFPYFGS